jgi:hypothetical protein
MTPWSVAGFVMLGLGVERLINFGLLGGDASSYPVRLAFATSATVLGGLLLAVRRFSSR